MTFKEGLKITQLFEPKVKVSCGHRWALARKGKEEKCKKIFGSRQLSWPTAKNATNCKQKMSKSDKNQRPAGLRSEKQGKVGR